MAINKNFVVKNGLEVGSNTFTRNGISQPINKFDATVAPATTDDGPDGGYAPGSLWIDTTSDSFYICVDSTNDAAVWKTGGDPAFKSESTPDTTPAVTGIDGIAVADGAVCDSSNGIAIGVLADAGQSGTANTEYGAIAIGKAAKAYETHCTAIGPGAISGTDTGSSCPNAVAIGDGCFANGDSNIGIGSGARATGLDNAQAFGAGAKAYERRCLALGASAVAGKVANEYGGTELAAIAIGYSADAFESDCIAIGANSQAGVSATSVDPDAIAIGRAALANAEAAVAIGPDSDAQGTSSVALGDASQCAGVNGVAVGNIANAQDDSCVALGRNTIARGFNSSAVGSYASAGSGTANYCLAVGNVSKANYGSYATAVGNGAEARCAGGTAFGASAQAFENYCVSVGYEAQSGQNETAAVEIYAIAMGYQTRAYETATIAIGQGAIAGQSGTSVDPDAIAIGRAALANAEAAVAIGPDSDAQGTSSVALGDTAQALGANSIAIGPGAIASTEDYTVAIGDNASCNSQYGVAIGYYAQANTNIDAIAIGDGAQSEENATIAIGSGTASVANLSIAMGRNTQANGDYCVAIGGSAHNYNGGTGQFSNNSIAIGHFAETYGQEAIAFGSAGTNTNGAASKAYANGCIAIGPDANAGKYNAATGLYAIAMGYSAAAREGNTIAIGYSATAGINNGSVDPDSIAIGKAALANAEAAIAIGPDSDAQGTSAVALGDGAQSNYANSVAIGPGVTAGATQEVHIGTDNTTKFILYANGSLNIPTGGTYLVNGVELSGGATVTDDTTTDADWYPTFTDITTGTQSDAYVSSTQLTYNPFTGEMSSIDFVSTSDARLKESIEPIKNGLDIISKLEGRSFNWKQSGKSAYGVIAQEVEKILPELVAESNNGFKKVHYLGIIGHLIEAVKELNNKIEVLESK